MNARTLLFVLVIASALAAAICCGSSDTDSASVASSNLRRDTSPQTTQSDITDLVMGNTEFALDLYHEIAIGDENLFYSPYSISLALAMTYAGARDETETQMSETLHFDLPQKNLHPALNALDLELESRGEGAEGKDEEGFRLNIANSLWGQDGYGFLSEFLDLLAINYGAGIRLVDFTSDPEQCRQVINQWVEQKTEDRIKDLIPPGILNTLTRLVLVNAIYFNAAWQYPFEEDATDEEHFHLLDGGVERAPLMRQVEDFGYAEGDGWQAAELPYDGRELSMLIVLPKEGRFEEIESELDTGFLEEINRELKYREVHLTMPRFEYDAAFMLSETLRRMGMPDAFETGVADFSGMDGSKNLFIREVIHKAFVSVDEEGTEAAAATAVVMEITSEPGDWEPPVEFRADRPFIFLIRDNATGAVLFVGRVMDPKA